MYITRELILTKLFLEGQSLKF